MPSLLSATALQMRNSRNSLPLIAAAYPARYNFEAHMEEIIRKKAESKRSFPVATPDPEQMGVCEHCGHVGTPQGMSASELRELADAVETLEARKKQ